MLHTPLIVELTHARNMEYLQQRLFPTYYTPGGAPLRAQRLGLHTISVASGAALTAGAAAAAAGHAAAGSAIRTMQSPRASGGSGAGNGDGDATQRRAASHNHAHKTAKTAAVRARRRQAAADPTNFDEVRLITLDYV